jgi:hypothetical protein
MKGELSMFERVKKFVKEHPTEMIMAGLFVTGGIAGGVIGYDIANKRFTNEASSFMNEVNIIKKTLPQLIDKCGELGFVSTMECINRLDPKVHDHILELFNSNLNCETVSEIFYNIPEIKELMATCRV